MDKETLSNYGWIVICVLVLAVMIALATPFGSFVSDAVWNTTNGLFDTSENALNIVGLSAGGGNSGTPTKDPALNPTGVTTTNGIYVYGDYKYTEIIKTTPSSGNEFGASTLEEAKEIAKQQFSNETGMTWEEIIAMLAQEGMTENMLWEELGLTEETFEPYTPEVVAVIGWSVSLNTEVTDTNQTSYGAILESINGVPVTNMDYTFYGCTSLTTAPVIPSGVTDMTSTFNGCTSLATAPTIPSSVMKMAVTFCGCTSLTTAPVIPSSVTNMQSTFHNCTSLTTAPTIPNSVTDMRFTFYKCTSLKTYAGSTDPDGDFSGYIIPSGVTSMYQTFCGCTSLTTAPDMSKATSVIGMYQTFSGCTSLTTAPVIPSGVTNIEYTFQNCTSLTTAPEIPSSVTNMYGTFHNCTSLTTTPVIPSSVTTMQYTFYGCTSLESIVIHDSVTRIYSSAFEGCTSLTNIILPDSISTIDPSAFADCTSLTSITFEGTIAQWNAVSKSSSWKTSVPATYVQCSDGQAPLP